ncbi:tumor necrosis factor ligand superfamily member 6-like [Myxocyprinus asiaticus]|uniref:tumor necrosis factor ligand superfamily member 6-like n=1 Tax=Myxocyprinus asiaticus TaxID=70543 RepID=UPI00222318D4|nr:tumor necrosis factor ligand superfamily member 6-like [Myxocyprinus asiaticus]XP_051572461.1 tumor necrosis factor ligand superfamily member 6-like [Myxocyprinus asiaticus]XP_051572463.1 tumor necrosis factor ligand superfamily member 6-like [Myxocyprinus asiaticus]
MAQGGIKYPSVFVVDSNARPPPLPPKPGRSQRHGAPQTLLGVLVIVALCGMAVEACFIYHLYSSKDKPTSENDPQTAMRKQVKDDVVSFKPKPKGVMKPSKPMAHLTTGQRPDHGVLLWTQNQESILYHVKHKVNEGQLIIEKEGFYSVYSKIYLKEDSFMFNHSVLQITPRYSGGEILLLQSIRSHLKLQRPGTIDNSYLSGVFHLFKGDAVFVRVKNCTLVLSNSAANYFGLFMV